MDRKGRGLLAYLLGWLGGVIVLFGFKDNDRKTTFHACQAITLSLSQYVVVLAISIISGIMAATIGIGIGFLSGIINILYIVLLIMGIVKAWNDEPDPKLPVIGDLTEKFFSKKINEAPETVTPTGTVTPKFDPNTGQPITQPQANFDPNTGQPITQPQANFDPNTGQPLNQEAPATSVEETPAEQPTTDAPTI